MDAIQVHEFTREAFGQDFPGGTASPEYLWAYLEELGATSMVREADYVDRHYLDDFTNFYARSFHPPDPHCRRLHFFSAHAEVLGSILRAPTVWTTSTTSPTSNESSTPPT